MCVCMVASVAARRAAKGGNNFGRNKIQVEGVARPSKRKM